jgi:hypothetical protein
MMTFVRPARRMVPENSPAAPLRGTANKKAAEGSLQQLVSLMKIIDQTRPVTV